MDSCACKSGPEGSSQLFFFFFLNYFHFRTQFAVEPIQTLLGKNGTSSGSCWIALMGLGIMLTALPGRSVTLHQVVNA